MSEPSSQPAPKRRTGSGRARKAKKKLLGTADIMAQTGLSRQVIYTYVTMGLIEEERRTGTGRKRFDPTTVTKVRLIQNLNASGYTLRDIKTIFFNRR
ncbi:MAG: helix-turn-helix domain-containing protein [Planctomycetota bacterium]|jgi:DNA-binding transcriptional MerR regulator